MSDANHDKGIWIYEHNVDGTVVSKVFVPTNEVCTPIYKIVVEEGDELPELHKNARNYVELRGKTAWITKMKKKLKGKANIKSKPTDRKMAKIDREKILDIFGYLNQVFEPAAGIKRTEIESYMRSLND